jgi:copper chaperone
MGDAGTRKKKIYPIPAFMYYIKCHDIVSKGDRADMVQTTLKIQGMTCNHCVMRVAKSLKSVPGVQDARVDLQKAEAVVSYDETSVSREKIALAVKDAGYSVVP